ncbi:uncharacterized protein CTRU02_203763 [Colletotrichum truncatum]|uniref:Uncharacterized protein n=1 Tax=Colletotrichum truncatum TaxID=5467 RepID=A0ACC3ZA80_COLTU|nr:uncharacterized protein CTRU02_04095 [Colletotrichum truncatum]KAF6796134.1 hypothetical protein CTRU02_04095 [Colletotrichum truncatum]
MATVGTDAEGQVKFLVSCIRFSANGKVDFEAVANDCTIVSKAAAAKRFERILKAHGMKPGDLSKGGPASNVTPTQSPAKTGQKTPSKGASKATPKNKSASKRTAPVASPTSNTKRAKLIASHPAVSSYNNEDDEEEQDEFKMKKEDHADVDSFTTTGSYYDNPRARNHDDDDLQLLYVVEKTIGCPIHDTGEYRVPPSVSVSSDTNTDSSTQMLPTPMSSSRLNFTQLPASYHAWGLMPGSLFPSWPDTCIHEDRDAVQLVGIC